MHLDQILEDLCQVETIQVLLLRLLKQVDTVMHHAGVMALPEQATPDGYDVQMQTNHLSHFLLASILMPALKTAAARTGDARIVCHSSAARIGGPCKAKYYGKNSGKLGGDGSASRWERYHQTKMANALFANALKVRSSACIMCSSHAL